MGVNVGPAIDALRKNKKSEEHRGFWPGMVRLCLLDSYGSGFSSLQATEKATKGKVRRSALCDVFIVTDSGFQPVFDENRKSGGNHVLDVPCRKCILLYCGYCVSLCIQR